MELRRYSSGPPSLPPSISLDSFLDGCFTLLALIVFGFHWIVPQPTAFQFAVLRLIFAITASALMALRVAPSVLSSMIAGDFEDERTAMRVTGGFAMIAGAFAFGFFVFPWLYSLLFGPTAG
jgi:hypothetical protein